VRILQAIETSGPGGAERVLIQLCRHLRARGHEIEALLLRDGWLGERLREQGTPVSILPLARPLDVRFARALAEHVARRRADVLHSHEITFGLYGRWAARRGDLAHVATAHGRNFARGWKRRLLGSLALRGRAFRLVAVSRSLALELAAAFHGPASHVAVVHNGIDLARAVEPRVRAADEPLRLVAVGNLYPVKNHALMIEALARLVRSGVGVELDVLGRGGEQERLRERIDALGLASVVRLRGFQPDVRPYLAAAHALVSTSLSEGLPLSFLEAMAAGLPVVASRVGGVTEIFPEGQQELLFESGDASALARCLERLAADDRFRVDQARRAVRRVNEGFGIERMVDAYVELYEELGRGRRRPASIPSS
jgi:glycosyltransferase involved in cell wall biosynthesis